MNGSYPNYPSEWTEKLRESVRKRDLCHCQICGKLQEGNGKALAVHHIDYNKDNLQKETNLIALCETCHGITNTNRHYWQAELTKIMEARGHVESILQTENVYGSS